jgi:hypothetical protein
VYAEQYEDTNIPICMDTSTLVRQSELEVHLLPQKGGPASMLVNGHAMNTRHSEAPLTWAGAHGDKKVRSRRDRYNHPRFLATGDNPAHRGT